MRMFFYIGEGKRSRLLGTIGVTRGLGDHDLRALGSGVLIKPFLSPQPDVNFRDLTKVISIPSDNNEDGDYGILIMATDGLWDVADITDVSHTIFKTLKKYPTERHRYTMAAQELVAKARGRINDSGHWRLVETKSSATVDDISVLVIPVYQYYKEYVEWERLCNASQEEDKSTDGSDSSNRMNISSDEPDIEINKLAINNENNSNNKIETEIKEEIIVKNDVTLDRNNKSDSQDLDSRENQDM